MNHRAVFIISTILLTGFLFEFCLGQEKNNIPLYYKAEDSFWQFGKKEPPNPLRAALLSSVFPGLGQIYNQRSVLPYIGDTKYGGIAYAIALYASFAGIIYMIDLQGSRYKEVRTSYIQNKNFEYENRINKASNIENANTTDEQIIDRQNFYRQERDRWVAGLFLFYIFFNVIEAYVTAELYDFNVNRNLKFDLGFLPSMDQQGYAININYTLD